MSPSKSIVNPLGEEDETADYGLDVVYVQFDPAASGTIVNGTVVKFKGSLTNATDQSLAIITSTTPGNDFIGVAVEAPAGGYLPGQVMKIAQKGRVNVLMDANNVTYGHAVIQSSATAGNGTDAASATAGRTLGIVLRTTTVGAANTLIPVWLQRQ